MFFKLPVAEERKISDPVLEVPIYEMKAVSCIVGLPGIDFSRPYLIAITKSDLRNGLRLRQQDVQAQGITQELLMIGEQGEN